MSTILNYLGFLLAALTLALALFTGLSKTRII
nr:cytochrome b6/f complex subunit VI [Selaginella remotifolia]